MLALLTLVAAAALGVFIGVLSGLLGVGGGTIMVPMFRLAFGLDAMASTATSLFTIIPTSVSGVITHVRNKTCVPKLGIAMGLGGACTSPLGVWLASVSPSWAVMLAAALVIAYSSFSMVQKVVKAPVAKPSGAAPDAKPSGAPPDVEPAGASPDAKGNRRESTATSDAAANGSRESTVTPGAAASGSRESRATTPAAAGASEQAAQSKRPGSDMPALAPKQLAVGVVIGLVAGVASGYVGLGGGFLMVPLMLAWIGLPMKLASGTSLIGIMLLAIPGTIEQGMLGNIDYLVGIATAIGTVPGAYLGARFVARVPERTLRIMFSIFLAVGAVLLVAKEVALIV